MLSDCCIVELKKFIYEKVNFKCNLYGLFNDRRISM